MLRNISKNIGGAAAGIIALLAACGTAAGQFGFTVLPSVGRSGYTLMTPRGISGDGGTVVGGAGGWAGLASELAVAYRRIGGVWTPTILPTVTPSQSGGGGRAVAVSYDGTVIGGMSSPAFSSNALTGGQPGIWNWSSGGTPTFTLATPNGPSGVWRGIVNGVSSDGTRFAGTTRPAADVNARNEVFSVSGGLRTTHAQLDANPNITFGSGSNFEGGALSGDGQTLLARRYEQGVGDGSFHAFTINITTNTRTDLPIGTAAQGYLPDSEARAASFNGSIIAGVTFSDGSGNGTWFNQGQCRAMVWRSGVPELLAVPAGSTIANRSYAHDLSADGRIIVGSLTGSNPPPNLQDIFNYNNFIGVLWIDGVYRTADSVLAELGVLENGYTIRAVTAISDDGRTITGVAGITGSANSAVAFVATIPAPGAGVTLLAAGIVCGARRRRSTVLA
ncbi:hypothetical protein BH11PLA1_BH11PLA1_03510 [soil metagenome]